MTDNNNRKIDCPPWLLALGRIDLPAGFTLARREFEHVRTFKHDFFAATALYESGGLRAVLKIGRRAPLFGLPMAWIGRLLCEHESRLYRLMQGVPGIPRFLGNLDETALVHEYVEGRPLSRDDALDDDFFPRLWKTIDAVHARGAAYVDLEKRENVLLGEDGMPHLIDFQISWHIPENRGGATWPARLILKMLQRSDRYHIAKHWRRLRPDQFETAAPPGADRPPPWILGHRLLFRPITLARRQLLVWLGVRDSIRVRSPG